MLKLLCNSFLLLFMLLLPWPATAGSPPRAELERWEISQNTQENTYQLRFYFKAIPSSSHVFLLDNPHRLVVDAADTIWNVPEPSAPKLVPPFIGIRQAARNGTGLRVVFDLDAAVPEPRFMVNATSDDQSVLIIDLAAAPKEGAPKQEEKPAPSRPYPWAVPPIPQAKPGMPVFGKKPLVILDAGHGGQDPGAISRVGLMEKDVTLDYAKALKAALLKTGRVDVAMTRSNDNFIPLKERVNIARKKKAHLFLSLHADSAPNRLARGLSVYTLSDDASDKEAELLAARENKADIIGGLDLSKQSDDVTDILIELAQRDTRHKSEAFADMALDAMEEKTLLVKNAHRFAGFAVLKAPDVPSVLVELGFLSNDEDVRKLRSEEYQEKMVAAMVHAIEEYFDDFPPVH